MMSQPKATADLYMNNSVGYSYARLKNLFIMSLFWPSLLHADASWSSPCYIKNGRRSESVWRWAAGLSYSLDSNLVVLPQLVLRCRDPRTAARKTRKFAAAAAGDIKYSQHVL